MFETEDLILCRNEKNFILCLLEVARFGSRFGIQVPTIIQLEQEIEAEIAMETSRILEEKKLNLFIPEVSAEVSQMSENCGLDVVDEKKEIEYDESKLKAENEKLDSEIIDEQVKKAEGELREDEEDFAVENDSLNRSNSNDSFMEDFRPISEISDDLILTKQKLDSELNWSRTSSSKNGKKDIYD